MSSCPIPDIVSEIQKYKSSGSRHANNSRKSRIELCPVSNMAGLQEVGTALQNIIDYQFNLRVLILEALSSAGSGLILNGNNNGADANKRLASVGKKLLELVIHDEIYQGGADRSKNLCTKHTK